MTNGWVVVILVAFMLLLKFVLACCICILANTLFGQPSGQILAAAFFVMSPWCRVEVGVW